MINKKICMIGVFPPPLHGMSLINEFVRKSLGDSEHTIIFNTSPYSLNRSPLSLLRKFINIQLLLIKFIFYLIINKFDNVYLGLSGGLGQIYDLEFLILSKIFLKKIYLHHHSYSYINKNSILSKFIFYFTGPKAIHIVACNKMHFDLLRLYPNISNIKVISGIFALPDWGDFLLPRKKLHKIGFISNLAEEKGVFIFLDIAEFFLKIDNSLIFLLAGPYYNEKVKLKIENRLSYLKNTKYLGPKYKFEKKFFFDSIDLLLFPTLYKNESEGLVIHEAMSRGVPVIAYARGCIDQIITNDVGFTIQINHNFIDNAICIINLLLNNPLYFEKLSKESFFKFQKEKFYNVNNFNKLCEELKLNI